VHVLRHHEHVLFHRIAGQPSALARCIAARKACFTL